MSTRSHPLLVLFASVLLAGACSSPPDNVPPKAPPVPAPAGGSSAPPPGQDDFARGAFATPLSVDDAENILRRTRLFEYGGTPPKRQVQAFNVVFEQPDAAERFRRIAGGDSVAGRLYAFAGLLLLDPPAAAKLRPWLAERSAPIAVFESDTAYQLPAREVAVIVERRRLGEEFRRLRDETNAHFARQPAR